jgi:peptidoglycan hydrolase-like protein with peptidoglycan-binding domain
MTQNAVRLFQEKNDLEVDGYVGRLTWGKLFSNAANPK